ncbi:ribonuclease P protein component [Pseudorhodobacter turbinis]|uniref:Ribonuclease P protein component n=1 Tax=Pseudorhodobacter turbinis TaxID=2500533 RepID=A0A4P8EE02_9RHOB|nr:ribonuclease P protein component [Pseudorhodobacter turbinis]QCO55240.1 ribonuclease P protein component [Pseudorhodobacter turbinis]
MTPPKAQGDDSNVTTRPPSAVSSCAKSSGLMPETLRQRADFLRAASARRQAAQGFLLQGRARGDDSSDMRVGFTCSKKIGNAVARNRAKRRLREIARAILPTLGHAGWDYVLVGRPKVTIDRDFAALLQDLETALAQLHAPRKPRK